MSDTQQIKDKLDVVDLVGEYVQLKPAGVNHKGLCPFHNEKSPSFMVNRDRQSWHCFGCSKGGDIFTFVQDLEGMDFKEALKYLADKAGVHLTHSYQNEVQSSQKNRLKEINKEATRFYHNVLLKMEASKSARDYLVERGLTQETIETWQIGFIPDQWDLLTKYLLKKGYSIDDLVVSGLTIKRDNADTQSLKGFYDRFRGRIMFPIWDIHDNLVGFTGRVLVETEKSGGKYVNTPQTPVYDKSRVVFGLNKAKKTIRQEDLIVMVEGQMDVIACHQAGMTHVVATSGTALTEEQLKLLSRYSKNLNLCFDLDSAGLEAADKHFRTALEKGMQVVLTKIPIDLGKDADECIRNDKENFLNAIKNAEEVMQWLLYKVSVGRNLNELRDKNEAVDEYLRTVMLIPNALYKDHWLQELSDLVKIDKNILVDRMKEIINESKKNITRTKINEEKPQKNVPLSRLDMLIERFIMLILAQEGGSVDITFPMPSLSTGQYATLYEILKTMYTTAHTIDITALRERFTEESIENTIDVLLMKGEEVFANYGADEFAVELSKIISHIKQDWMQTERTRLTSEIYLAEKSDDADKVNELMKELMSLK